MKEVSLVFPHQLFRESPIIEAGHKVYLIEEDLFFNQYKFHKQKIAFHRASMKAYADFLFKKEIEVEYIHAQQKEAKVELLIKKLISDGLKTLHYILPTDNWLEKHINKALEGKEINVQTYQNQLFLNTQEDLESFFASKDKKFFQTQFYKEQRIKRNILLVNNEQPKGGKWSFDAENRKKYPKKKTPPSINFPKKDKYWKEACEYVEENFDDNLGELNKQPIFPYTDKEAKTWLNNFLAYRFHEFGDYEDAIVKNEHYLNHSILTPMLNVGLLTPQQILEESLAFANENEVPINSTEGFVRQIMGWREFIRGMYEYKGSQERTTNFWGFNRKIPASFYDGTTGIEPVDITIKKVLQTGYCHHIERLMILGNFMLLCEFDPDEVYRWFMELFIDAYDWVMVPNVYGMSQFADGGLMATKPYISGSNYIKKMSDYGKADWNETWDALFWRFMHVHRDFFSGNPRLAMLLGNFDKRSKEDQKKLLDKAESYLQKLDN